MNKEHLFSQILNCAFKVHSALGPGLLENAYKSCLLYEIRSKGFRVEKEIPMPLTYREVHLETGYRIDLMVHNSIIIEVKAVEALNDVHMAQILTYLRLAKCELGLLVNFNVSRLKNGIKRVILTP